MLSVPFGLFVPLSNAEVSSSWSALRVYGRETRVRTGRGQAERGASSGPGIPGAVPDARQGKGKERGTDPEIP